MSLVATKVSEAIGKKFQFKIKNTCEDAVRIAIVPAYFDTLKLTSTQSGIVKSYSDPTALNAAGLMAAVDAVLSDGTVVVTQSNTSGVPNEEIIMSGVNGRTIREFLKYRETNALQLKSMTIKENTADEGNFEHEMELCKVNPFNRQVTETIETSKFYDRYQYSKTKLDIDFGENELEICDDLLWVMTVPSGSDYTITLRF